MVNTTIIISIIALGCAFLSLLMLLSKDAITAALSLLGILLGTAAIYALMGEHFIATIQLVVYAGAIMVLFIFSIMLLNIKKMSLEFSFFSFRFLVSTLAAIGLFIGGFIAFSSYHKVHYGEWTLDKINQLGGNTQVLAHELFTHHFVAFEAISIALMVALIGAVVLAKRKINQETK